MKTEVNIQSMVDIIFKKKFISVYNYLDTNMSEDLENKRDVSET